MIIGIVGAIIGISALVISILGLFYTRQRTKIMEEQLSVIRKETERKRTFEEASKAIRQAISMVKKYADDSTYFDFPLLDFSRADILTYMHDNKIQTFKLHIKPKSLGMHTANDKKVNVKTAKDIIDTIKGWVNLKVLTCSGGFDFSCDPDILGNPDIELEDAFYAISDFYRAHRVLESYDYVIDVFDHTILDEMKQTIDRIVEAIFKSCMSKHEITFSSTDTSEEILQKLQNEIVGRKSVLALVKYLSEICDQRLSTIQKEIFLKS